MNTALYFWFRPLYYDNALWYYYKVGYTPIAQWIERGPPEAGAAVRPRLGVLMI